MHFMFILAFFTSHIFEIRKGGRKAARSYSLCRIHAADS